MSRLAHVSIPMFLSGWADCWRKRGQAEHWQMDLKRLQANPHQKPKMNLSHSERDMSLWSQLFRQWEIESNRKASSHSKSESDSFCDCESTGWPWHDIMSRDSPLQVIHSILSDVACQRKNSQTNELESTGTFIQLLPFFCNGKFCAWSTKRQLRRNGNCHAAWFFRPDSSAAHGEEASQTSRSQRPKPLSKNVRLLFRCAGSIGDIGAKFSHLLKRCNTTLWASMIRRWTQGTKLGRPLVLRHFQWLVLGGRVGAPRDNQFHKWMKFAFLQLWFSAEPHFSEAESRYTSIFRWVMPICYIFLIQWYHSCIMNTVSLA